MQTAAGGATGTSNRREHGASHVGSYREMLAASSRHRGSKGSSNSTRKPFRFISTFKWEARKGWDILLEAYLTAFTADDDVE